MCWRFRAGEYGWHRVHDDTPGLDLILPSLVVAWTSLRFPLDVFVDYMTTFHAYSSVCVLLYSLHGGLCL